MLLICNTLSESGYVHVFQIELYSDLLTRYVSPGKLGNRLRAARYVDFDVGGSARSRKQIRMVLKEQIHRISPLSQSPFVIGNKSTAALPLITSREEVPLSQPYPCGECMGILIILTLTCFEPVPYFPFPCPDTGSMIPRSAISFKRSDALDSFISITPITSDLPKILLEASVFRHSELYPVALSGSDTGKGGREIQLQSQAGGPYREGLHRRSLWGFDPRHEDEESGGAAPGSQVSAGAGRDAGGLCHSQQFLSFFQGLLREAADGMA